MIWAIASKFCGRILPATDCGRQLASWPLRTRLVGSPTRVAGSDEMPSVRPNRTSSQLVRVWKSAASEVYVPLANEPLQKYELVVWRFQLAGTLWNAVGAVAPLANPTPSTRSSSKWQLMHDLRPLFDHK